MAETAEEPTLVEEVVVKIEIDIAEDLPPYWYMSQQHPLQESAKDNRSVADHNISIQAGQTLETQAVLKAHASAWLKQEVSTETTVTTQTALTETRRSSRICRQKQYSQMLPVFSVPAEAQKWRVKTTKTLNTGQKPELHAVSSEQEPSLEKMADEILSQNTDGTGDPDHLNHVSTCTCKHCKLTFGNKRQWRSHNRKRAVPPEKTPFVCQECGIEFKRKDSLKFHMVKHTGQKAYICQYCGTAVTRPCALNKHIRRHTGQRPYACQECDATFYLGRDLRAHMMKHTGERPYACQQCDATYVWPDSLKRHMVVHSGKKPYFCEVCGASFRYSGGLKRHHVKEHKGQHFNANNAMHLSRASIV